MKTIQQTKIIEHDCVAKDQYKMVITWSGGLSPGQFLNLKVPGKYLRRPFAPASWDDESASIYYMVVGEGTKTMSELKPGDSLEVLGPLGNGYDLRITQSPLYIVGGGLGAAPLLGVAKELINQRKEVVVLLGFNNKSEVVLEEEYKNIGVSPIIYTVDGSYGKKGFSTSDIPKGGFVYGCGPNEMIRALEHADPKSQFSFESVMACGFGACMGCSLQTKQGMKRICVEGPVFTREEVIF